MRRGRPRVRCAGGRCGPARVWPLGVLALLFVAGTVAAHDDIDRRALARIADPPLGLPEVAIPADNAPSLERVALGRTLFFDRRLSRDGTMSCGMCHIPEQGFTNNELATPVGSGGSSLPRNAPTLLNVAYFTHLFHDGRDTRLETQVILPLLDSKEMANPSIGYLLAKLSGLPDYAGRFERAFGAAASIDRIGQAIASWERSLLAANSAFDRWRYGGESDALDARARRGFDLFVGKAGCSACHLIGERYAIFTDDAFHDTGIGYRRSRASAPAVTPVEVAPGVRLPLARSALASVSEPRRPDHGRYEVTRDPADLWRFKTPGLRNVALTAPYMHDGSLQTLEEVVRFYDAGGHPHPGMDPLIRPLGLSHAEILALVAFLQSLTGDNIAELVEDARSAPIGN